MLDVTGIGWGAGSILAWRESPDAGFEAGLESEWAGGREDESSASSREVKYSAAALEISHWFASR